MVTAPKLMRPRVLDDTELVHIDAAGVNPEDSLDSVAVANSSEQAAHLDWARATFLASRIEAVSATGVSLDEARFSGCEFVGLSVPTVGAHALSLERMSVKSCRFGALKAPEAVMHAVEFVGCKIGYLNVRSAKLRDVSFRDCEIGDFDALDSDIVRCNFPGSSIANLSLHGSRLRDMDLRGARLRAISDVSGLQGATLEPDQVRDLASAFATHLGIRVEEQAPSASGSRAQA